MEKNLTRPDYIFEVSWEVCNKVGGIHTVITSKALTLVNEWEDRLIMIGPDTWKGEGDHPEFIEDKNLFSSWRPQAAARGLKIKIGRWKITGNPIAVLVDFTPFFTRKDEVFSDLWLRYKVDSLTGGWDYIEPALFGYAAGKVIESFYHHHLTFSDKIIAQFHEWITGVGLLYLNERVPQIGTVFTTHATAVGRSIAGNGLPLYSRFDTYNADQEARNFNIMAKHSLEKMSALNADCFTTVSEITAKECVQFLGKKPDVITPNGFEDFIVPDAFFFKEKRTIARNKLLSVAEALMGYALPNDALLVLKSGRYEFRNKGIDLFIDALGELNKGDALKRNIVAFIFIPAHSTGPRRDLLTWMEENYLSGANENNVLTHYLQGADTDPILSRIRQNKLDNRREHKVKVIFAPVYMSGHDGIFNLHYYDLLTGFDLSAFPSYYEPWGYTPLESLAFHIPTVTTNLTGFGMIVHTRSADISQGISVIDRNDTNDREAVVKMASVIKEFAGKTEEEVRSAREAASRLSKTALWKNYIIHYKEAYSLALEKANSRSKNFIHEANVQVLESSAEMEFPQTTTPVWRKIFVQSQLPEGLKALDKLAHNVWWTWNPDAAKLFESIDNELWERHHYNPILLLDSLPYAQLKRLEKNKDFVAKLNALNEKFEQYLARPVSPSPQVAYFCMEYGLCANLKLYSGGLGILAGDYLKEASDSGVNLVGVGLLYRNGYFRQEISLHGDQLVKEDVQKFTSLPLHPVYDNEGEWLKIAIAFPGRTLYAKAWQMDVGKVALFLLDTDIPENRTEDRSITGRLYGGDWENRLKQELLLGIGGVRLLRKLGLTPEVYHYNEGHAAFAGLERLLILIQEENISFEEGLEVVRSSSLFTTHTPVPAGHDTFSEELMRTYLSYHASLFNINWKHLMALGRSDENDMSEKFSMSYLAARLSQEINGVSKIHEVVSRKIFSPLWKGYSDEELHIGHVTNGVHFPTWASPEWQSFYENVLGKDLKAFWSRTSGWEKIQSADEKTIWDIHSRHKKLLLEEVRKRLIKEPVVPYRNVKQLVQQVGALNENTFIIGFARRFVTYKRSYLLFSDTERLYSIIKNSKFPVLFLFAGKAHPNDTAGHEMIRQIIDISNQKHFQGRVLFLQNYDMELAKYILQGVDVWLNTPEMEKEASGTSGMKAALNGVLNLSMPDGWWAEAYHQEVGWSLGDPKQKASQETQGEIDSETLYQLLEQEILPLYSDRNKENVPVKWVGKIKNSISRIAPQFTAHRMLMEYMEVYYKKLQARNKIICSNHFEAAKKMTEWKQNVFRQWNNIHVESMDVYDSANKPFPLGSELTPRIVLDICGLSASDIGVEVVFINKRKGEVDFNEIIFKNELTPVETKNQQVVYECRIPITQTGVYEYGFRVFPKNPLLPHRQDFPLLKWI